MLFRTRNIPAISFFELLELKDALIIDVRDINDYQKFHLDHSVNVPFLNLLANPQKYLVKNQRYYLICNSGNLSQEAVVNLLSYQYDVVNVIGGINNYLYHY